MDARVAQAGLKLSILLLQPSPQLATYTIITSITSLLLYSSLFHASHYWQELSRHQVVTQTVRILHFIGCISELTVYSLPESHFVVTCPKQPCFVAVEWHPSHYLTGPAHLVPFLTIHLLLCWKARGGKLLHVESEDSASTNSNVESCPQSRHSRPTSPLWLCSGSAGDWCTVSACELTHPSDKLTRRFMAEPLLNLLGISSR